MLQTAKATAMIFFIILGAAALNNFLALSQLPQAAVRFVVEQGFDPWAVLILMLVFYLVLGCFMDSLSMILLTVPLIGGAFYVYRIRHRGDEPEDDDADWL